MKKRLLAVLLACCMAAGMANAVFAADELPATAESAAAIAPADPDPPAPEPEIEAEPTPAADPEPEIEAEPTPAADPAATPETARTLVMDALLAAPDTAAQTAVVTSAELVDSIRTDGCFTAKVNGSTDRLDGAVYTWYRSKDGTNWEEVPQQLCSGDAWNITPGSEHRLNAALDACIAGVRDAERLYYKVEVTGTDGAKLTAAAMQVPYCIQLQNGSFETPDIAGLKAYHNKTTIRPHPGCIIPGTVRPAPSLPSTRRGKGASSGRPPARPSTGKPEAPACTLSWRTAPTAAITARGTIPRPATASTALTTAGSLPS